MSLKILLLSSICAVTFIPVAAPASENIRVAIADNQKTVIVKSAAGLVMDSDSAGRIRKKMVFGANHSGNGPVRVRSIDQFVVVNGRSYRGWIELRKKKNGLLLVINDLDIEDYLMGVIAEEVPRDWEFEAQKAQAVASRSYALYQKRRAGRKPYHILATVNGQVYAGRRGERDIAVRAVRETEGVVLVYNGEVISAFYHSSCGGHTEDASELWNIDAPYLKGVDCDCQEISKYGQWERRVSLSRLAAVLGRKGFRLGKISSVNIKTITRAGRVKDVVVRHAGGLLTIPAETLRAALGNSFVPSVFFELSVTGNEMVISGRGRGHGVGLCQWGAQNMALKGYDFKAILKHYYPGTRLMRMDDR